MSLPPKHLGSVVQSFITHTYSRLNTYIQDREAYLDALNTFYRIPLAEGRERFGPRFCNNPYLTAAHNTHKVYGWMLLPCYLSFASRIHTHTTVVPA